MSGVVRGRAPSIDCGKMSEDLTGILAVGVCLSSCSQDVLVSTSSISPLRVVAPPRAGFLACLLFACVHVGEDPLMTEPVLGGWRG